jgi:ABC-type ATPase with predicted acetyltransferase domain
LDDPFSEIMKYIFASQRQVAELYRLEKTARWDGSNTNPECKKFVAGRLAAGSQMLANLWYTAWLNSASR